MLTALRKTFGTITKAQEILLLLKDAKSVVRQGFYESELPRIEAFCKENKLFYIKSKFKVLLDDPENSFSNRGLRITEDNPRPGMFFIYISKYEKSALLASYAELLLRHKELGQLLGYPECCIDFFIQHFNEKQTNLELSPTNLWTNLSKRDEDCVLLSHFPCSSECQESIKLAKQYYKIIMEEDKERGKVLGEKLVQESI